MRERTEDRKTGPSVFPPSSGVKRRKPISLLWRLPSHFCPLKLYPLEYIE
ncbi:MAG: hypothetical protein LBD06_10965 [Candidatus Accumulibacter sp.]|nr:hypothetical protein [Accumulibacter sp.]